MTPRRVLFCVPHPSLSRRLFPLPLALCTSVRPRTQLTSPVPHGRALRRLGPVSSCVNFSRLKRRIALTLSATHRHGQTEHAMPSDMRPCSTTTRTTHDAHTVTVTG